MIKTVLFAASAAIALAACGSSDAPAPQPGAEAQATADTVGSLEKPTVLPSPMSGGAGSRPTPISPVDAKSDKGARAVLLTWARALENRDFALAWQQFRDPPATRADYARWWSRYRTIAVAVPDGVIDGGAGSLYYTTRATLTGTTREGKPFRLEGDVILRRVNDVDGATPDQLQWHIASADLKDASAPEP